MGLKMTKTKTIDPIYAEAESQGVDLKFKFWTSDKFGTSKYFINRLYFDCALIFLRYLKNPCINIRDFFLLYLLID